MVKETAGYFAALETFVVLLNCSLIMEAPQVLLIQVVNLNT